MQLLRDETEAMGAALGEDFEEGSVAKGISGPVRGLGARAVGVAVRDACGACFRLRTGDAAPVCCV